MFGKRLIELMDTNDLNKAKLIRATGITEGAIDGWMKRGSQPTADMLCKLADYFEVSTDYLLGRSNDVGIIETNANLTQDQQELLSLYNRMSFQDKNQLIGFAKALVY